MYSWFIDLYFPVLVIIYLKHYLYSCISVIQSIPQITMWFGRPCSGTGSTLALPVDAELGGRFG
jgi:hypothetical protein